MKLFILLALMSSALFANDPAIVLIPGTGNSLVPGHISPDKKVKPHYSRNIINFFAEQKIYPLVVGELKPFGSFIENGVRAATQIRFWYEKNFPKKESPLVILGHSAGGFYALKAAELLDDLPVKYVVAVSTPLKGSRLADHFVSGRGFVKDLFDLRGLLELRSADVQKFLTELVLPNQTKLLSVATFQRFSNKLYNAFDAQYLHPVWKTTASIFKGDFDGIISYGSALGQGVTVLNQSKSLLGFEFLKEVNVRIGHAEQVMDYRLFAATASKSRWIAGAQRQFFRQILQALKNRM